MGGADNHFRWLGSFFLGMFYVGSPKNDSICASLALKKANIALCQRLLSYSNPLGLFSEMVDPTSGEALDNFPQALTHLAVIITGLELTKALQAKNT